MGMKGRYASPILLPEVMKLIKLTADQLIQSMGVVGAINSMVKEKFKITLSEYMLLKAISNNPNEETQHYAKLLKVVNSTITNYADTLEICRYIKRIYHNKGKDRRKISLRSTNLGEIAIIEIKKFINDKLNDAGLYRPEE